VLPYSIQILLGFIIGIILYILPLDKKRIIRKNLELCFPEKNNQEIRKLVRKNFASLGMSLIEIAMSWWSSDKHLKKIVKIEGLEHMKSALQQGHGVILLSGHFTTLELGGRLLRQFTQFHVMYREQKNPLFDIIMTRSRIRNYEKAIHRRDIKTFIQSLKENNAVWYAPDQNFGGNKKVFAPFFGIQAATNPATSRLAKIANARVVPFFQIRLPGLRGYKLKILPALDNFPSDDVIKDTARINKVIEGAVRESPEQYLWAHRRFKDRPEGENYLY
jgi:KDO2-lipid IV(A) lauroyltransferase